MRKPRPTRRSVRRAAPVACARRALGHEVPADVALLVLDEDAAGRVERAPGPGALLLEGRVRRLRRALEVPKGRAAVRRERLEV